MSKTTERFLKAIAGVAVVAILLLVVSNWWGDYRRAASDSGSSSATQTVDATRGVSASSTSPASATATTGVVLIDGLNFRKKPETGATTIRGLKRGEKVTILVTNGDWYQVKDAKGVVGWIAAKSQYVRVEK